MIPFLKIKVYPNKKPEYLPDILFEDGTFKDDQDYIERMRNMDKRIMKELNKKKAYRKS